MAESDTDTEIPAPEKRIILEESLLRHLVEKQNVFLFILYQQDPKIKELIDKADGIALVDSPVGIGGTSEYWQTFRDASLRDIHQERNRIYRMQVNADEDLDAAISLTRALHVRTAKLDPPPPLIDHYGVGQFWRNYVRTWDIARNIPIYNRLMILHWCESLRRSGKSPPETNLLNYARNRDNECGKGRPTSLERWRKRKGKVVQLLFESGNEYDSPEQFYLELAVVDDKWGIKASTVRTYFKRHLGDRYPEDMEQWRQLASYWLAELHADRKLDWKALGSGWEPSTS